MRGTVPGLATPTPLIDLMPAIYQEDELAGRLTAALDEVLAPVFSTLDSLEAFVDPTVCPTDFVDWLGGWVGVTLDEDWPLERRRALVARAVELYTMRGTAAGLRTEVELFTGGTVEIAESGGTAWSPVPGGTLPGEPSPRIAVRVTVDDVASLSEAGLSSLVAAATPAWVTARVEVVERRATARAEGTL